MQTQEHLEKTLLAYVEADLAGSGDAAQLETALVEAIGEAEHLHARLGRAIAIANNALRFEPAAHPA